MICQGYTTWNLEVREEHNAVPTHEHEPATTSSRKYVDPALGHTISPRAVHRAQTLAAFMRERYPPKDHCVAPYVPHIGNSSLLHVCASFSVSAPLLDQALDAMCLAHLASKSQQPWIIHEALNSRGELLARLRAVNLAYRPKEPVGQLVNLRDSSVIPLSDAQSIIIAIVLLSVMPPIADEARQQTAVHLQELLRYLVQYGPSFLTGHTQVDTALIRHLQVHELCVRIALRRNIEFQNADWAEVPRVFHEEENDIYRCTGFFGRDRPSPVWRQPGSLPSFPHESAADRDLVRDLIGTLPSFLEAADEFYKGTGPHSEKALRDMATATQNAHDVRVQSVLPSIREAAKSAQGPAIRRLHISEFDPDIEEHAYLLGRPGIVDEHYRLLASQYCFPSINLRYASLITDCTILNIAYCGMERDGLAPDWTGLHVDELEQRARTAALQMCQHIHYHSQRSSITAARYLRIFVKAVRNFFQSAGAEKEAEWCEGCMEATSSRIARLTKGASAASICPMIELFDLMTDHCRYTNSTAEVRQESFKLPG